VPSYLWAPRIWVGVLTYASKASDGYDANHPFAQMNGAEPSNEYGTESSSGGFATETVSSAPSINDATVGNDGLTMEDFLSNMSEHDGALMRAQGHSAVYNRPRVLQRVSWATTEVDMAGVHDRVDTNEILDHGDMSNEEL
jgi:hypothetical protein